MPRYCSFCGTKLREDGNFCEGCGRETISDKDWAKEIENNLRKKLTMEIEQNIRKEIELKIRNEIEEKLMEENKQRFEYEVNKEVEKRIQKRKKWSFKNILDIIKNNSIVQIVLILFGILIALNIIFYIMSLLWC